VTAVLALLVLTACLYKPGHGAVVTEHELPAFLSGLGAPRPPKTDPPRTFRYLDYAAIKSELARLEELYPDLVEVYDAQTRYGLPSPGSCGSDPCKQYVLRITNEATLPDPDRPEVFFSGELHGNERVGPTTMMEFARLLLESYAACDNPWLQRLVNTRSIVIMPSTNALGYFQDVREENHVDPNRDFPIDNPSSCMTTIAARAVNEVWREHLFQVALTYHGGMQSIAFEWGTRSNYGHDPKTQHKRDVSPDDTAQLMIGSSMSAYAGAFEEGLYPHGRLNDQVYPVRGGMEDWAYAASWADSASPCSPSSYGGYPPEKTTYSKSQMRAFNILIECASAKTPRASTLGGSKELLRPEGEGDGHVPRNLRLALLMTDIVQPYVQWVSRAGAEYEWEVGGAMHVDSTFLEYGVEFADGSTEMNRTEELSGPTRWSGGGMFKKPAVGMNSGAVQGLDIKLDATNNIHDRDIWPYVPAFRASLPDLPPGSRLTNVTVVAMVDQIWKRQVHPVPDIPPQSHLVNARTSADWVKENAGHRVIGQLWWRSETITFSSNPPSATHAPSAATPSNDTSIEPPPTFLPTCQPRPIDPESAGLDLAELAYVAFLCGIGLVAAVLAVKLHRRARQAGEAVYEPV